MSETRRTIVYISGPISGMPNGNRAAFQDAYDSLEAQGYQAINPHYLNSPDPNPLPESATDDERRKRRAERYGMCLRKDINALTRADAIAMLPGWGDSRGACLEMQVAIACGLQLFFLLGDGRLELDLPNVKAVRP